MLDKNAIGNAQNVGGDPGHRSAVARESSVNDHEFAFGQDDARFVLERRWRAPDQIEQSFAARRDMRTVLNVVR